MADDFPPRQAAFIREYLVDLNATAAAKRAGYSAKCAHVQGARLLKDAKVRAKIDEAKKQRAERVEVKSDDILRELLRIMNTDVGAAFDELGHMRPLKEMPEDLRRAISSVEVDQDDEGGAAVKLRMWDKLKAIELLGKHLKMFTENHRVEHSFSEMTDEQLEAKKREIIERG